MVDPIIELAQVSFRYAARPVLEDISLHLHSGQCTALVGPSGAGKTTLLKLILGTLKPQQGQITLCGAGRRACRIGYVPQLETVDWQFPVTVEQVVLMGRRGAGLLPWASKADRRAAQVILERLEIGQFAQQHIRNLSGGQQQRVFLARALLAEPDLLVLDEPTTGVDGRTAENVLHLLVELNQQGLSILLTTHDLNAAAAHIPWIVCLNQRIVAEGPPEQVFTEAILNATYQGDMLVIHHEDMIFVQQRPHPHGYRSLYPQPVTSDHDAGSPPAAASLPLVGQGAEQ